jgi:hypothetical protein
MEIATRRTTSAGALLVALLAAPVLALAQGPVLSFDQLDIRLRLGATVYVTDAQGREIKGKIQSLAPDALTLDGDRMFARAAAEPRGQERRADRRGGGCWPRCGLWPRVLLQPRL